MPENFEQMPPEEEVIGQDSASAGYISPEEKLRITLHKRMQLGDDAQVLSESVNSGKRHMNSGLRFLLFIAVVIVPLGIASYFAFYKIVVPRWVYGLSGTLLSPQDALPVYKRVIQGTLQYSALVNNTSKQGGIADIPRGGSVAFSSSTTVIPQKAFEGVFRMDFDKPQPFASQSDVEVHYTLVWDENKKDFKLYFFPSRWPGSNAQTTSDQSQWLFYTSQSASPSDLSPANLPVENFFNSLETDKQLLQFLWSKAIANKFLSWNIDSLLSHHTSGSWVTKASITLNQQQLDQLRAAIQADPLYASQFKTVIEQKIGTTTLEALLASLTAAKGTVTIGTFNHLIYETHWNLEMKNTSFGNVSLQLGMSVSPLLAGTKISTPTAIQKTDTIGPLVESLEGVIDTSTTTTTDDITDTDGDGITDHDEKILGTDPAKKDSDGDGFPDLEEIQKGFNPAGSGTL